MERARFYRIGGDEFILVGNIKRDQLEEIQTYLQRFVFVDVERDVSFDVTVAVGVSTDEIAICLCKKCYTKPIKQCMRQNIKEM